MADNATPNPSRLADLQREAMRTQLERDPITAARAAQRDGKPLAHFVRVQCDRRGIDPTPYLEQIAGEDA
ncbi:hypothetical protein [Demequina silvatica]|uniref:hypothetical protein n=1 Tax=Demequina silvatica TaxID=1638988 RepID=UPI0007858CB9|nr:hypothetical protein [Demequina silvatica]